MHSAVNLYAFLPSASLPCILDMNPSGPFLYWPFELLHMCWPSPECLPIRQSSIRHSGSPRNSTAIRVRVPSSDTSSGSM